MEALPALRSKIEKGNSGAREVLLEYGLPPLGTKEIPNPA